MSQDKPHVNLVVLGHVDCGKSTTLGHLIHKCGGVDKLAVDALARKAGEMGRSSLKYAWILDQSKESRQQGLSVSISNWKFETPKLHYTFIDVPGHTRYVKNTICGISQADCVVLVVSAAGGEFHVGFSKTGQTREHILLSLALGVRQMIVCINKMDDRSVNYEEKRFQEIKQEICTFLNKHGFPTSKQHEETKTTEWLMPFIPISAWEGDNLVERSDKMKWYQGPTLLEALDAVKEPKRTRDQPLRLCIDDAFRVGGVGTVAVGRVEAGTLKNGTTVTLAPAGIVAEVKSMEMHHMPIDQASAGDNVGINLKNALLKDVGRGMVVGDAKHNPPRKVVQFEAKVMFLNHPGYIKIGYTPTLYCHTARVPCKITKLIAVLDKTGKKMEENPHTVKKGQTCLVEMEPRKAVCLEPYAQFSSLGRFILRDGSMVVGIGLVQSVQH